METDYDYDDKYYFQADVQYWLGRKLIIQCCRKPFPFHYIYRCSIKDFKLAFSTITLNDFLFIVKENTIKKFFLAKGFIKNSDGSNVGMDSVLQMLPNVEIFIFHNAKIELTPKQLENIATINLWNKLKKFFIIFTWISEEVFSPMSIIKFIQKNSTAFEFDLQIIVNGKNSKKNYEALKDSVEMYLKDMNGEMGIYDRYIPHTILIERSKKMAAKREATAAAEKSGTLK